MLSTEHIERLRRFIRQAHECDSTYVESVPVNEMLTGQVPWEVEVAVFYLASHPQAKRCYAWSQSDDTGEQIHAVLELPPVDSAVTAVSAKLKGVVKRQK